MSRTPPALLTKPTVVTTRVGAVLAEGRPLTVQTIEDELALYSERTLRAHLAALCHLGLVERQRGHHTIYCWSPPPDNTARRYTAAERAWLRRWRLELLADITIGAAVLVVVEQLLATFT
jgi:hypothetical protein